MNWVILAGYVAVLAALSILARKKASSSPEEFFLAGRSFGPVVLFLTLAATNFSAFFFLGFAGAAWKYGFGQYAIMGLGTALVPVSFYFIGRKVWKLGKEKGYLTAPELIGGELGSPFLRRLVLVVMVVFTVPYLLTQALGAGMILSSLAGIDLTRIGAIVIILLIGGVVVLGGMRGSAWTDVLQGGLMILAMLAAVFFVAKGLGGFQTASQKAYAASPALFMRPGPDGFFTPQKWFSFIILWSFVNPLFPQLFTRFYTARSLRSLRVSTWLYPLLVSFLFLAPVLIGVWANGTPVDPGKPDMILPAMVAGYAPGWVHALVMTGALAALMSTADSQLLALSTMLARDAGIDRKQMFWGRVLTLGLCLLVVILVLLGVDAKGGIFTFLTQTTFAGLVVLTPATVAALYFKKIPKWAAIASIIAGEASVVGIWLGWLPTFGLVDGIVALIVAVIVLTGTWLFYFLFSRRKR
ncbi:sodium:solute symporter family protein [candidate division WOR-3 bacterium]|nr:sodium:solute symporter family protein [candidate division WOR-3 bacterium]